VRSNRRVPVRTEDFELLPQAVRHCENMSTTGIEVLHLLLARATSRRFKVALSGEGADEVFGGYIYYRTERMLRPLGHLPRWLRRLSLLGGLLAERRPRAAQVYLSPHRMNLERFRALSGLPPQPVDELFSADLKQTLESCDHSDVVESLPPDFSRWHPFRQLQFYDLRVRLPDFVLRMADHNAMAHSVEGRVPFLDHELVELCAQMPAELHRHRGRSKPMLREVARGLLPREIARRRKRALQAPCREWLRGELPDFAREMLSGPALREAGYFDPQGVRRVLERHRQGEDGLARAIMGCLIAQLWDKLL
jgi:asparagine synthase (glutamine-hydrolysing)